MNRKKNARAYNLAFLFLVVAVSLGLILRLAFSVNLPEWIDFTYVRYAHTHMAMLGWLLPIFVLLLISVFKFSWERYRKLYLGVQASVLGMAIAFLVSGYSTVAIVANVIYTFFVFVILYRVLKDSSSLSSATSQKFLRAACFFFYLASASSLALAPITSMGLKGTAIYYGSIQFYLHFLINGFFMFSTMAIFFQILKKNNVQIPKERIDRFFWLLVLSTILTFALSVTWSNPTTLLFFTNSVGVSLQLIAFYYLYRILSDIPLRTLQKAPKYIIHLLVFAYLCYFIKVVIQAVVIIPYMATISYTIHNFIIGFIHLMMLGIFTPFVLGVIGLKEPHSISPRGVYLYFVGVLLTELLLFFQGLELLLGYGFIPHYYDLITAASVLLVIAIYLIAFRYIRNRNYSQDL